jgi:hypothetical protein
MIFEILKYYAQFPNHSKLLEIFAKGRSDLPEYAAIQEEIKSLPKYSRIQGLDYYIFGQSFDSVKQRVDGIVSGTYLFVEIGDIMSKRDQKNNIQDEVQMAVTIAAKSAEMDLIEEAIQSRRTLSMMQQLRVAMTSDQRNTPWLKELSSSCQIRPFVTKEFASIGWTLMFDREGSDLFDIKRLFNRV